MKNLETSLGVLKMVPDEVTESMIADIIGAGWVATGSDYRPDHMDRFTKFGKWGTAYRLLPVVGRDGLLMWHVGVREHVDGHYPENCVMYRELSDALTQELW